MPKRPGRTPANTGRRATIGIGGGGPTLFETMGLVSAEADLKMDEAGKMQVDKPTFFENLFTGGKAGINAKQMENELKLDEYYREKDLQAEEQFSKIRLSAEKELEALQFENKKKFAEFEDGLATDRMETQHGYAMKETRAQGRQNRKTDDNRFQNEQKSARKAQKRLLEQERLSGEAAMINMYEATNGELPSPELIDEWNRTGQVQRYGRNMANKFNGFQQAVEDARNRVKLDVILSPQGRQAAVAGELASLERAKIDADYVAAQTKSVVGTERRADTDFNSPASVLNRNSMAIVSGQGRMVLGPDGLPSGQGNFFMTEPGVERDAEGNPIAIPARPIFSTGQTGGPLPVVQDPLATTYSNSLNQQTNTPRLNVPKNNRF